MLGSMFVSSMVFNHVEYQLGGAKYAIHSNFLKVSDIGQVWGWGYGGEGQLGLGSRIRMVSSPHLVPCINSSTYGKDRFVGLAQGSMNAGGQNFRVPGNYVKGIACGGRHSAVITGSYSIIRIFFMIIVFQLPQRTKVDDFKHT